MPATSDVVRTAIAEFAGKWRWFAGLGGVLLIFAAIVLFNITTTTRVTTWLIGLFLLLGGVANVIQALFTEHRGNSVTGMIGGALCIFGGIMIMREPTTGSLLITILAMMALAASGIARILIALKNRHVAGWWVVLLGGIASIGVGLLLIGSLPWSSTWVLGMLIGTELGVQGISWVVFGLGLRHLEAQLPATIDATATSSS